MITITADSMPDLLGKLRGIIPRVDSIGKIEKVSNGISITIPEQYKGETILITYVAE